MNERKTTKTTKTTTYTVHLYDSWTGSWMVYLRGLTGAEVKAVSGRYGEYLRDRRYTQSRVTPA